MVTLISGADTWLTLNNKPLSFQANNENLEARAYECNSESKEGNNLEVTSNAPKGIIIFAEDEQLKSSYGGFWEWRPPLGYAGLCELRVSAPGYPIQVAKVRVLPEKLSQDRYKRMLADLDKITVDLLIRLNSSVSEKAILQLREQEISPLRDYKLMNEIMNQLEDIMFHIHRNPHRLLQKEDHKRLLHEVYQFSSEMVPIPGRVLELSAKISDICGQNSLPEIWMVPQNFLTYDVYENRLLKQFLRHQLAAKLYFIQQRAKSELKRLEQDYTIALAMNWKNTARRLEPEIEQLTIVVKECDQMMLQCVAWISETFLKSVKTSDLYGKATQILLKNPFYSRFFQIYLYFQQELTISLDTQHFLTELTMQKVSDLYEVWSVFEITRIVVDELKNAGYIVASNTIFYEVERNHFQVKIRKNAASIVMKKNDIRVEIKYEPIYLSKNDPSVLALSGLIANLDDPLDTQRTPDLAIEVYQKDQPISVIIFDVKYKWQGVVGSRKPTKHDKGDMREYRDIICYQSYNPGLPTRIRKIVSNAYILYPGDEIWEEPPNKVGALPFVPDMASNKKVEIIKKVKNLLHIARLL